MIVAGIVPHASLLGIVHVFFIIVRLLPMIHPLATLLIITTTHLFLARDLRQLGQRLAAFELRVLDDT